MSFVMDTTPVEELPLMVEFEAKSIGSQFKKARDRLERM